MNVEQQNLISSLNFWDRLKIVYVPDILESFSIAMAITVIVYYVFLIPNMVEGQSMEPNFHERELLFTDRTIEWLGSTPIGSQLNYNYKYQDIIIFQTHGLDLIKRVIGLPGDKIKIVDGKVFRNGQEVVEDYLPSGVKTFMPFRFESTFKEGEEVTIPADSYFCMGDNRNYSKDSRYADVGFINRKDIKGRVLVKYWPVNEFKIYTQK
jgi:signal peptidase I